MAVAKKSPKKTVVKTAAEAPAIAKKAAKKAPATTKVSVAAKKAPVKATAKTPAKTTAKVAVKAAAKPAAKAPAVAAKTAALKPVKTSFTKVTLVKHLAEQTSIEPKTVKTLLAALEDTMLGSLHKRGAGEFTLPGLLKLSTQKVAARKKGVRKDPFTGLEREFPAKPASVRVKARALKKLKDAAL